MHGATTKKILLS